MHFASNIVTQQAKPQSDWPYDPDWIVDHVSLTKDGERLGSAACYPVVVQGLNLNDGRRFIWELPLPLSWRYDLSKAVYDAKPRFKGCY